MIVDSSQSSRRMSSVAEVTVAVRQVAAHEARIVRLTERIDEMRDYLDHAGWRLQVAESRFQAGGTTCGPVKFALSKKVMPDSFNGTITRSCLTGSLRCQTS